jgi:hypothetical protein
MWLHFSLNHCAAGFEIFSLTKKFTEIVGFFVVLIGCEKTYLGSQSCSKHN